MKILYIGIWKNEGGPPVELCGEFSLQSYNMFVRNSIKEIITFVIGPVAAKTPPGVRERVTEEAKVEEGFVINAYGRSEGVCGIVVSDAEYPELVAQQILSKTCDEFLTKYPRTAFANASKTSPLTLPFPVLKDYIVKYQDPAEADSITKIQRELDEAMKVIHKTMESVMERGEKIDSLVAKSDGLSAQSKMFYTQAKKQNSCCTVM